MFNNYSKILCTLFFLTIVGCSSKSENWETIDYSNLIDFSIITHSGETINQVINNLDKYVNIKGLIQPYLEPQSILCNNLVDIHNENSINDYNNIVNYFDTRDSEPGWVALLREGRYQIFYNNTVIRVFVPVYSIDEYNGTAAENFNESISVLRHPINLILSNKKIEKIEIYKFVNSYKRQTIKLNTNPDILIIAENDYSILETKYLQDKADLNLSSLDAFFKQGLEIVAAEYLDDINKFYLYGKKNPKNETMASEVISLSDLAVTYRSIYHHKYNEPYISLDTHEDNRYAKVNFGGLLENTRVGHVVLEADKLFKTISTGLDPNSHKDIINDYRKYIKDFYPRNLLEGIYNETNGVVGTRYWFYPDSISVVTDDVIGVIENYQFLANIERLDSKQKPTTATRETIKHLNENFGLYTKVDPIYSELSNVGRLMSIINWMKYCYSNKHIF